VPLADGRLLVLTYTRTVHSGDIDPAY
jgi:hypothetical protein